MKTIYNKKYIEIMSDLKSVRVELGMTQAQVCDQLGRSSTWLTKIEHSEVRLDVLCFLKLCWVYGISAGEFISNYEIVRLSSREQDE